MTGSRHASPRVASNTDIKFGGNGNILEILITNQGGGWKDVHKHVYTYRGEGNKGRKQQEATDMGYPVCKIMEATRKWKYNWAIWKRFIKSDL